MFNTIADIIEANGNAGQHFFDRDAMRFFNSRVYADLYVEKGEEQGEDVTYFVTSERQDSDSPRLYTVRYALDNGEVSTASEFMQSKTLKQARKLARIMAGEDLKTYRWIMYVYNPQGGFEVSRVETLDHAVLDLYQYTEATGYYYDLQVTGQYGCSAVLYPYSADNWTDAKEYEGTGNPFDYPSKMIEFGPRGGARITSA